MSESIKRVSVHKVSRIEDGIKDRNNSINIASQLPIAKWHEAIKEPSLEDAIMDRLITNAHRIDLIQIHYGRNTR